MAKFQRLGPVWRKPKPKPWKQKKACTVWANERQNFMEYDPSYTSAIEIVTGEGFPIFTESSNTNEFVSIIQE